MHKRVKQPTRRTRRPGIEEIEPRILYSADFAPALVPDASVDAHAEQRTVDPSGEFNQTSTHQAQTLRHEIVFVDAATPDYEKLIADIRAQGSGRDIEVVLLDADKDGVAQITKTLAGREDVSAVHIVSHGADGSVQLGQTSLDFDSLLKNGAKIKGWGAALTADADILIYGCNVAQTDSGRSLVDALARLTGADVAASDDLTGSAKLGGDWDLEFRSGQIDTSIVFSQSVVLDWNATLAGVTVGGETKANTTTTGTQETNAVAPPRVVAMDANGNYVVVWTGEGPGDTSGVFFQRYNASGVAQGSETRINQTVTDTQDSSAVAMDASGNFVVAWRSNNQDGSGTGIYARRYNAAGTALSSEFRVNGTTANAQDNPTIAMNASGAFVVIWASAGQDGDLEGVYAQRYNASGVAQGGQIAVNTTTTGNQWPDSVAMDAAGNFVVTFSSADASGSGVWMRRFSAAGAALSGEVRVNSTTSGDQDWSSVAMTPDGDYVVAWRSLGQDAVGSSGIYAQRYNASGVAQGGEFRVNSTTAGEQQHPAVAIDVNGNFMVVWASQNQDAAGTWGIYKQEYNADGTANGGEGRVNSTIAGDQLNPAVAMNAVGQTVVAWAGNGTGDGSGVFFQRYATALVVDTISNAYDSSFASATVTISQLLSDKGTDGKISLREAIFAANNTANANANSPDRIYFNIAGAGPHTIALSSALPNIVDDVIIDGTSAPDFAGTPVVELNGAGAGASAGLTLAAGSSGSTIKGLAINRFAQEGILITASSNNVIKGNFLGTSAAGTVGLGNLVGVSIILGSTNNTIGGTTAADRNIISANTVDGIQIRNAGTSSNVVRGNYIGLDVTGTVDLGNTNQGVAIFGSATNNTIGGTAAGAGNVLSGNNGEGVRIAGSGTVGNVVIGNYIGTNAAGTAAIANSRQGVWIDSAAANNTIGGTASGVGNTIAYNILDGVALSSTAGTGNAILRNSIFSNGGLGIDLLDNGVTANDGTKTAGQPNQLMDFPAIQSASLNGTSLTLAGYIGIASSDTDFAGARVEFFESAEAAGTNGEGQVYLGFLTADASGNFSGTLTVSGVALGDRVTATATDGSNNTSEFAVNATVASGAPVATNDAYSVNEDGTLTAPAASNWWNTSWGQRKQLTFDNTGQAENLTNFAVLVKLDSTRINYALTQNAGQDLRFVDANGTLLAHEIETWNESGTSYVWVSVPQIDASSGSDYIWMYYGNASAPDAQNPTAVWDTAFTGVWHLNTDEQDSAGTNDGINSNSTNASGVIASAQSFNGTNAQVYTTTQFTNPQQYTVEAWFRTNAADGSKIIGFEGDQTGTASLDWDRHLYVGTDGHLYFGSYYQPTDSEDVANSTTNYADGAWHYAVGVRNNATDTLSLYVDGVLVDTSPNISSQNYNGYWRLGGYKTNGWPAGTDGFFNGSIDEARVSNQVRSAAWVTAQYLSMTDTFVSFSSVQGIGVLNNDTDPNGDALTSMLVSGPSNAASFTLNANGSFTYTPTANFAGTDTFTYRANDGSNNSNVATVTITVNPVNDAPAATITPATYAATEQTSLTLHGTGLSIADVDAGTGTLTATLSVVSGTLTVAAGTTGAAVSGSGTNSVTLTGTLTQINNLLAGSLGATASYIINSNTPPASDTLTLLANDGGNSGSGGAKTGSDSATINIGAVNDAPTATITPTTYAATEQTSLTLHGTGLSIADVDASSASVTATLSVVSGTLTVTAGTTGAAVSGSGSNSVTLTGTLTQINNLLAGSLGATASYIINSDTPPTSDTLTLLANDGGNTGSGGAKTGSDSATINIGAVNDAPTATITPATYAATEQTSLTLHGTGLSIADVDASSASVTATLSVVSGTLTVTAGTTGAAVSGSGSNSVTLTGTLTQINNLLAGSLGATASYIINSDTPPTSDTLTLLANDGGNTGSGGAKTGSDSATINIGAVNDAPTATITPATYAATEQTSLTLHGTGLSIADVDASSASVTATLSVVSGTLTVTAGTTGAAVSGSGSNSVTLTGTLTQINNLLAGSLGATASYIINSNTPPASDTLTLLANDGGNTGSGGAKTGSDSATINIGAVNDAPTATITPATYAATEQTSLTLHGTGLSIADVDASSASVTATLSVVSGTLTVTAGTTGAAVSGSGSNSVTLTGTLTQINNLLAGSLGATASYIINSDTPPTSDTLTLLANDGGNTGSGGAKTGSDSATINIGAVNDAPTATITPATYAATEQTSLTLHGTGLSIADVDASSASVTATLSVVSGTLTVTAGTTGAAVSGSGSNSVTLTGTLTQINNLLAGSLGATASYIINSNTPPASDTLTLLANDGGNTGSGGAKTGSDSATINIGAVNDAPTATITPATYAATEQTSLTLHGTGLSIADVDASSASVTATLSVVSGTLTVTAGTTGAAVSGSGSNSVTLTGTLTQINNLLAGSLGATASYIINSDTPPTSDTLTLLANDGGNTGSGGAKTGSDSATINIGAVNDVPVNTVPPAQGTSQNTALVFSSGNGNPILIADVDAASSPVQVTLTATNGTLTLAGATGLTFSTGNGTGDATMTFTGTVANINAALNGMFFDPTTSFSGAGLLTITTNDLGNTGTGGALSQGNSIAITVNAASIPTASADNYSLDEDGSLNIGWWDTAWSERKQITFAGNTFAGAQDLSDFPVLLTLNSSNTDYLQTRDAGEDLRFFDADGTPLAYEIEKWDETGDSYVWVKVPQIDTTGSDSIWMYYGNATAVAGEDPTAVWSGNGFRAVYHMSDTGTSVGDSTSNALGGSATNGAAGTSGIVGGGFAFDGVDDYVNLGTNRSLLNNTSYVALSAWINTATDPLVDGTVIAVSRDNGGMPTGNSRAQLRIANDNIEVVARSTDDDLDRATVITTDAPLGTGWHYITATIDFSTNAIRIYLDGVEDPNTSGTASFLNSATPNTNSGSVAIGSNDDGGSSFFHGSMDEARISIAARSAGWIQAEYLAMTNAFLSIGAAQTATGSSGVLANDSSPSGQPLSALLVSGPAHAAAFTLNPDGTFIYTPLADYAGADSFTYFANDGSNDSNIATVTLTINPVNDPPAGNSNIVTTSEDVAYTFAGADFGFADLSDTPANSLDVVRITALPAAGTLTLSGVAVSVGQDITAGSITAGNLKFTPAPNTNGAGYAAFTFQVRDDGGTANGGVDTDPTPRTMTINVSAVNDAPSATIGAGSYGATEQVSLALHGTGLSIGDVDAGSANLTATLSVVSGTLTINAGTTGVVVGGSGSSSVTLTGTLAQINDLLAGNLGGTASYIINSDTPLSSDTLSLSVNDGGNTGSGGAQIGSASAAINIGAVNDAPTATITPATYAATEQVALVLHGTGLSIADADAGGASVTATISVASGSLTVSAGGTGVGVAGSGTNSVTLTGTLAQINDLLAGNLGATATYIIGSDAPPASDTLTLGVNDGGNTGPGGPQVGSDSATINIAAVNDPPTATITAGSYSVIEQVSLALHGTGLSISDVDAGAASVAATLSVVSGTLTVNAGATGVVVAGSGGNTVTLTGTLTQINNLLAGNLGGTASYVINSDTPTASDTLTLSVNDGGNTGSGGAQSGSANVTIAIGAVNDAPTATITPATYSATEQTSLTLHGTGLSIADPDAGSADITATLSVVSGALTVTAGTTGVTIGGSGTNSVTLTGTLAQINNLLAGNSGATAVYAISSDAPPATDTLTLSVDDEGNSGSGGAQSGSDTATINIAAVNDAPSATIGAGSYGATEQVSLALHGTGLSIGDVDAGSANLTATLSVVSGTLTINAGTTGVVVGGSGSSSVTLTGTLAQINDLLAGNLGGTASYIINSDTPLSSDTLSLSVNDGGNTGSGGAQIGSASAAINIGAVNDAPTATITPATYAATEQVALVLHGTGLSIADADAGGFDITATLSVVSGALTVTAGTTGVTIGGSGTDSVTLTGTLAQINDLLAGNLGSSAIYIMSSDAPPATDTLTLSVNDGGNAGSGGAQSGSDSATINIAAVNDAPVASIAAASYVAAEQTALMLSGTGLSVGDADAGTTAVTATVSVASGTLSAAAGTTGVSIAGNGTSSLTLTGTLTQINDLLAGASGGALSYLINSDTPPASDTLTLSVNDGGNSGSGGAQSGSANVTINIAAVNDAPTATIAAGSYAAIEQIDLALEGTGLSIADADAGAGILTASLSVVSGTLNVSTGASGVTVTGSGSNNVTLIGTRAQINNLLAGNFGATGSYVINTDTPPASDTLTLSVDDGGNTGSGGAQTASASVTIGIVAVNDAPTGAVGIVGIAMEDAMLTADTSGIGDADGLGAFTYQWARSTDGGTTWSSIGGATAATYTLGDADVNALIQVSVSYTDGQGTAESVTSVSLGPVANVNDAPSGAVVITGTVAEDQTLTADTGSIGDADGLGAFSYQWARSTDGGVTWNDIAGATASTYVLGDADVGNRIQVSVSYTDGQGSAESLTSAEVGPVGNVNDTPTGAVSITGTVTEDQTLTADTSSMNDVDGLGAFGYQWLRNGVAIGGATSATYTLDDADVGTQISVQVSYIDGNGTAESLTSAQTAAVANINDAPTGAPAISGTPTEDQILTADTSGIADADGVGALGYQWLRDGVVIGGATAGTYTLGDADVGTQISVQVSYADAHGTAESLTSPQTAPVANVNDAPVGLPAVSGTPTEDQVLTADTSGISDADGLGAFGYQWLRDGVAIGGATAGTYTLGDADVGTQISVQVSYTDGYGTAESLTSAQTAPVANVNDAPAGLPAVSGTPTESQVLTADTSGISDADGLGAFSYQWLRDGVVIGGATGSTYTLGNPDVGTQISVQVNYTDGYGTPESLTSAQTAPVANVNDPPTGAPTISGTPTEDQILTADTSGIADADGLGAFSYQWLRNGIAIGGATAGAYTLGDADVGTQINVQVSYTDGQGSAESLTSAQTAPVANVNDAPAGLPVVSGTPTEDQVLTADTSGITDADGLGAFSYQWLRNGAAVGGAVGNTYILGDADVGTQISVQVSYTDGHGTAESLTSTQTGPVANVNDAPTGVPTISGTPTEDQVLTVNTSTIVDADGLGAFSYQWLRDGVAIVGATAGTYTLADADVGTRISVQASYTDAQGTAESLTSAQSAPVANLNDAPTGVVTIAGAWTEDQTLTADTSSIADADGLGAFSYQWLRNGVAIGGATGTTYTLGDADVGSFIQVAVAYSDGHGSPESLLSVSAGPVANVDDAPVVGSNTLTIGRGEALVLSTANLSASDVDNPAGALTFSVSGVSHGHFELTSAAGVAISSFTQAELQSGLVVFVHDGSRVAPGYAVTVSDGALSHGPLAAGVSFDAGTILVVPVAPPVTAVTNAPPAEPKPEAPAEAAAAANAAARVIPAVYSPGRVDPPEAQLNQMQLQPLNRQKAMQPVASFNHFEAGPYIDPSLELLAAAPANLQYLATVPVDWHVRSAFPEAEEAPKDRIDVLLEQVQLGGMALSVGVVWWASRVSGLLGSLLASAPAWRHIDPLPVVGRDEDDEKKWYDPEDRDADANELAIADVLEGAQAEHGTRDHTERG